MVNYHFLNLEIFFIKRVKRLSDEGKNNIANVYL